MMSECKLYLTKSDLIKMLKVVDKFPEYEEKSFKLMYNSCEIGHTLDMIIETTVEGINGELRIPIVDVSDW